MIIAKKISYIFQKKLYPKNFLYSGMELDLAYYPNSPKKETPQALWKNVYTFLNLLYCKMDADQAVK